MSDVALGSLLAGRYQLVASLGRGRVGRVYKAIDRRLDRAVAIKIAPSHPNVEHGRLDDEAKATARLRHPNIVAVLDVGEADGHWYLVTEFAEGHSLAEFIRAGKPLELDDALEIAAQIGQALAYLHAQGMTHRDIKPANVFVDESGRACLLDFGLASPFRDTPPEDGMVHGTPTYMSPEQAMGRRLDGRSDIYSLAVVLFELLAGRRWMNHDSSTVTDILRRVVETPLPPIHDLNPNISPAVAAILDKALAKDPNARYATAEQFVRALRSAQSSRDPSETLFRGRVEPSRDSRAADLTDLPDTAAATAYAPDTTRRLHEFAARWDELCRAATIDSDQFVAAARTLARGLLREAVGYRIEYRIPYLKRTIGYMVEAPFLWIRQSRFPILFVAYTSGDSDVLATVVQQIEIAKATEYFALLIVVPPRGRLTGSEARELNDLVADSVYRHDFVVLDREHLFRLVAENSSRALIEIILEQRTELLADLSPYVVNGPVPENMFFGRESQLKMISQGIARSNFAVVGGRKIGKSSVLLRLRRLFGDDPRYRAVYIDCEARLDHENFLAALAEDANVQVDAAPSSFRRVATAIRDGTASQTVVFLLDEIDELLEFDAGRQPRGALVKAFRAASHEGICRFVFSGGRTLYRHLHDGSSPFFNFCETTVLGRLQDRSVAEIVQKPMRQLGFDIPDGDRLVARLIEATSSHPNLAQWICDRLIKTSVGRLITVEGLDQLARSPEFQEHYVATAWGDATPLERLISLVMEGPAFTDKEVLEKLEAYGAPGDARAVRDGLDILCLYSLLDRDEYRYRFGLSQFPRIVRENGMAPGQIAWLVREARNRCS